MDEEAFFKRREGGGTRGQNFKQLKKLIRVDAGKYTLVMEYVTNGIRCQGGLLCGACG